jgi:hypothetical protein
MARCSAAIAVSLAGLVLAITVGLAPRPGHSQDECVVIEDFRRAPVGQFPPDWKPRKESGRAVYAVHAEGEGKFLRATARDVGVQAAKEVQWDLATHPVLAWSWRPRQFPKDADERTARNDSVLAVYGIFPHSRFSVKAVKYLWSEKVPLDTHLTSSGGLTQVRVVRSGAATADGWEEVRANVREDYRRYFKESEVPKPVGIAVLTDADDTHSVAVGDYANFRLCRS